MLFAVNAISNPISPAFKIMNFTFNSANNWSITCQSIYFATASEDYIIVKTSHSQAYYYIKDYIQHVSSNSWIITPDSLTIPLSINKDSDKVFVMYYSPVDSFIDSHDHLFIDSITFGDNPKAMFKVLKENNPIIRNQICISEMVSNLHYSNQFTLKGKVYDKYGNILSNALLFKYNDLSYDSYNSCMIDSFTTNANGEYTFNDYQNFPEYHRNSLVIGINIRDIHYLNIQDIIVPDSQQTIVTRDIHLKDDLTESSIVQESKCMLYPNPSGTFAILQYSLQTSDETMVEIFNLQGICIERYTLKERTGSLHINLDSKYQTGMYLVQVKTGSKILYSKELIVIK